MFHPLQFCPVCLFQPFVYLLGTPIAYLINKIPFLFIFGFKVWFGDQVISFSCFGLLISGANYLFIVSFQYFFVLANPNKYLFKAMLNLNSWLFILEKVLFLAFCFISPLWMQAGFNINFCFCQKHLKPKKYANALEVNFARCSQLFLFYSIIIHSNNWWRFQL